MSIDNTAGSPATALVTGASRGIGYYTALELANQLHASGEVLAATPNWWKQTPPR